MRWKFHLLIFICCSITWTVGDNTKLDDEENLNPSSRLSRRGNSGYLPRPAVYSDNNNREDIVETNATAKAGPEGRFLSLFTVITFKNDPCTTLTNDNGTCYSANECSVRGGVSSGPCAQGFGVCCIFSSSCGDTTRQNSSYFSNLNYPSSYDNTGSCQLTINKADNTVCQLRLDFYVMVLFQPESNESICNRDQFIVTGGSRVPSICGVNTGQHMYVDTDINGNSPITLTIVTSGTGFARQWRIKISQIPCDSIARADNSCLQYYTGVAGTVRSFNYDGANGRQLSNQDYTICIRTERSFCGITYSVCPNGVFSITGGTQTPTPTPVPGIGAQVGAQTCNSDWLTIPCASDNGRSVQSGGTVCQDRLCGDSFASFVTTTNQPVISTVRPFRIVVHFDGFEATVPNTGGPTIAAQFNNRGFCLSYIQQPCTA